MKIHLIHDLNISYVRCNHCSGIVLVDGPLVEEEVLHIDSLDSLLTCIDAYQQTHPIYDRDANPVNDAIRQLHEPEPASAGAQAHRRSIRVRP